MDRRTSITSLSGPGEPQVKVMHLTPVACNHHKLFSVQVSAWPDGPLRLIGLSTPGPECPIHLSFTLIPQTGSISTWLDQSINCTVSGRPSVKIVKLCSRASVNKVSNVAIVNIMRVKSVSMAKGSATIAPGISQWKNIFMNVSSIDDHCSQKKF